MFVCVLPSLLGLFVDVGQNVSSTAGPLTHHHWDRRALLKVVPNGQDHIGTPLEDQGDNGDTLTDSWKKEDGERALHFGPYFQLQF